MFKKILFFLLISSIWGCNSIDKTKTTQTKLEIFPEQDAVNEFKKYITSLDTIPLPFKHSTTSDIPKFSISYFEAGFQRFKLSESYKPIGIIFSDEIISILEYSISDNGIAPFLITYNQDGVKIDSILLYSKSGSSEKMEGVEHLIISKNKKISVKDTIRYWNVDERGDRLEPSIKITSGIIIYQIDKKGKLFQFIN